jgi:NAD(P)-dependent dehydrogenase (short-subunit alcohol dehydrogenase family)
VTSELPGTSALITGGTSGIGRASALALAELGAGVGVVGRNRERDDQVVSDIRAAGAMRSAGGAGTGNDLGAGRGSGR